MDPKPRPNCLILTLDQDFKRIPGLKLLFRSNGLESSAVKGAKHCPASRMESLDPRATLKTRTG
jgi:hypothetical protein